MPSLPRLPEYWAAPVVPAVPRTATRSTITRASAEELNKTVRESLWRLSGRGVFHRVTYGEDRLVINDDQDHLVAPRVYDGHLLMAVRWGWGPCAGVQHLYINGEEAPPTVLVTHYSGTDDQLPDPTLQAAIPGFNDAFVGMAYSVIRVPPGTITGFPATRRIEADFRGRIITDPRNGIAAWTENPALFVYDFITSSRYGPGQPVEGAEACADRCEELVAGAEVRCLAGVTLAAPTSREATLDLLTTYAECLWVDDGEGVLLTPDAPVAEPEMVIEGRDIRGKIKITCQSLENTPTVVNGTYRERTGAAEAWPEAMQPASLPGVDTGEVEAISSEVNLPGIFRPSEMYRKVLGRLRRLNFPAKYEWPMYLAGVKLRRGCVVKLPNTQGLQDVWVRIMSAHLVALGTWRVTAEHYDPSIYPDDYVPPETAVVPVGGVLPFSGAEAPDGWELWDKADGRYLVGAGDDYAPGDTGGVTDVVVSGETGDSPLHNGTDEGGFWGDPGTGSGRHISSPQPAPRHKHTYASSTVSHFSLWRRSRFIKKTGLPGQIPAEAGVFSNGQLISSRLQEVTAHLGRLVRSQSDQAAGSGGQSNSRLIHITTSNNGTHPHGVRNRGIEGRPPTSAISYEHVDSGGHRHNGNIVVNFNPRRRKMVLYLASAATDILPGAVIGWDSDDPPPAGWHFTDGNNGTVDLTKYYIELSAHTAAGETAGDNTASWSTATIYAGEHDHLGDPRPGQFGGRSQRHGGREGGHVHAVSGSVEYKPPYYALRFIQYTGVE